MQEKIGIIGYGNMGHAVASCLKVNYAVSVFDKDKHKMQASPGVNLAANLKELVVKSEVIILAIKPQDLDAVLKEIKDAAKGKLAITIAAGISTRHVEKFLPGAKVVRAMPNIGAKIAESVTCICKGHSASDDDLELANEIFYYLGVTRDVDEELLNAATVVSGSGPAYVFYFIEQNAVDPKNIPDHARHEVMMRLEKAAMSVGFSPDDASFLSANTVNTSLSLLKKTGISPAELRQQVTSKGGTTEAALKVLVQGGTWDEAALAGLKRAQDLARRD